MTNEVFCVEIHDFELLGHKYGAQVEISTCFDECVSIDDLIDSKAFPDEAAKLENDLNSGNASVLIVMVKATCSDLPDLEGNDSLGAVIVYNDSDVEDPVREYCMVENALSDLVASYTRELEAAKAKVTRLESIA